MAWYIIAGVLFAVAIALLIVQRIRDRRYLTRKTSQTMGDRLWKEVQDEREASKERRQKFRSAMKRAEGKEG